MPASWVSFLIFICFVAPGFYFEQISGTRRVRAKESAFQEISRTVLGSVVISIPAGLVAFVTWVVVTGGQPPDFAALFRWENAYVGLHFGSLFASGLGYLAASFGIVTLANQVLSRHLVTPLVHKHTLWTELFRVQKRPDREAAVMVVMKSGDIWQGLVGNFSADHEADDRELVLYEPILHRSTVHEKPVLQQQVVLVLRGSEISSIGINYTQMDDAQKSSVVAPGSRKSGSGRGPNRMVLLGVLVVLTAVVLVVDLVWVTRLGSTAANAFGGTLVAIGGVMTMLGSTDRLDWSKRNWRPNALAVGSLLVGLGGVVIAISAWLLFSDEAGTKGS